jgi:23S rRNA U2552 (ribose-2'-O)-methylase RlmE/FtsJ
MSYFTLPKNNSFTNLIQSLHSYYDTNSNNIINKSLYKYLINIKTQIDSLPNDWDKFKKYTNPYEYIHTIIPNTNQSVCNIKPLSRSFFKMIEICKLMHILELLPETCKSFHLAEGPGGFIEAFSYLRNNKNDTYYGMTLIDDNNSSIPGWKKSKQFLINNPNVIIEAGIDGTGNLMNTENLRNCYDKYNGSIDLVTGDGGFDFSIDYNQQESIVIKLLFCQISYAIAVQRENGVFIIKFFDTFTKISLDLLYLLTNIYDKVYFVKPNTSRYANSEKYIVCKGFLLNSLQTNDLVNKCCNIISGFTNDIDIENGNMQLKSIFNFNLPYIFTTKIEEYNSIFGQQQIENILVTLNMISHNKLDKIEELKKINIQKCIIWCQKYNIPYYKTITNNNIFKK